LPEVTLSIVRSPIATPATTQPDPSGPSRPRNPTGAAAWLTPHQTAIWRYLRMLGASRDEADDILQETMVIACSRSEPSDPELARPFLRGVARNLWLRTRRWWQRRREREIAAAVDELWLATVDRDDGDLLLETLRHCLDQLQPRVQQALSMHYRDGLGWDAIAAHIGLKANGTKTLAQRARQTLRTCIERRRS
jgi:RNA polymerase sigma-70 factor (ECF subfamily)